MESYGSMALSRWSGPNQTGSLQLALPATLGRALHAKGYNRVQVFVTHEGILLKPYISTEPESRYKPAVELPDWS